MILFAPIAYLRVKFSIVADLFCDGDTRGFAKAVWIVALIFLPFLTALLYLVLDAGASSPSEFEPLKAKALSGSCAQ